jgi:hypothetical protein
MSYQLNKTDGTLLTDLIDGQIDNSSTNLVLVGRNYSGYGEYFNENFIKLLESFANTAAPSNPLTGQVWWDITDQRLKVYDGTVWKASGGPFVQDTRPQMVAGDLWIDNLNNQLYAYDGSDTILIGPQYTATQGKSGFVIGSLLDLQSRSRTVAYLYIGDALSGVFSNLEFTPIYAQRILGLITDTNPNGTIYEGFNVINKDTFKYHGIASGANSLVTGTGVVRTADQFLPSDSNGITVGTLTVQNSGGLTIGLSQNNVQKVVGPRFYIENQLTDHDLSLRVKSSAYGSVTVDGIYIDASAGRVGIFTTNRLPQYTLDVEGDLRVTGNLLIEGDTTSIDVTTLRVEDKNIEIAKTAAGAVLDQADADNAGLILDITESAVPKQKLLTWKQATNAWTSNVNVNISDATKSFMIGGIAKLSNTTLEETVINSSLENLGTLTELQVDEINVNGKTISSTNDLRITSTAGIAITSAGAIAIQDNQKITGLATPTDNQDAANKLYVDTKVAVETIAFSMDITGLGVGLTLQNAVAAYLGDMYPVTSTNAEKYARIHATSYAGATVDGVNVEAIKNISFIAVDSNGTQNESVVQDIVFAPEGASGAVVLTPTRSLMVYKAVGTAWVYQTTTAY